MALLCHCTLTHYKLHEHEICIKVFGLAFYKKQAGLGGAQGLIAIGTEGLMRLNEAISKRLEEILISKGMTQYELFKKSGVPRSTIGNVINCSYDSVKLRIIHEMCLGLEIGIGEFFTSPLFDENNLED
ncbi:MAG: helix-turn-helix transcriptional regulator [Anaerotignum sp.]|nr:helix-turn-helix transcriptional regulator [Anaerotignum sp.]